MILHIDSKKLLLTNLQSILFFSLFWVKVKPKVQTTSLFKVHCSSCGFISDNSFNTSSMDGLLDGLLLVHSKARSSTCFISSCDELEELIPFSLYISLNRRSLALFCVLDPAVVKRPLLIISRTISPKL